MVPDCKAILPGVFFIYREIVLVILPVLCFQLKKDGRLINNTFGDWYGLRSEPGFQMAPNLVKIAKSNVALLITFMT